MKTGIFGGTFNPIHYGHLRLAEETRELLTLDRIIFIPCHLPPHKSADNIVSSNDRLKMLELALENNPHFELSHMEIERGGKSYSFETLQSFIDMYGEDEELFFIIGADSFVELGTWKEYAKLFSLTNFVVVTRLGYLSDLYEKKLNSLLPVDIRNDFCYASQAQMLEHKSGMTIYFLETTSLDISSTNIRENLSKNGSAKYLIPDRVGQYIKEKGLYQNKK